MAENSVPFGEDDAPFSVVEGDEIIVHYSGRMPDYLINTNLPDLDADTPSIDVDIIVLSSQSKIRKYMPEDLVGLTDDEKREIVLALNRELNIKPLIWSME